LLEREFIFINISTRCNRKLYIAIQTVIFIQLDQPALIETGECLGSITSELKPGIHTAEFVCGGPKNYAYKTVNPATGERETVQGPWNKAKLQRFQTCKFGCHTRYILSRRI
jgi:hypothetical protein